MGSKILFTVFFCFVSFAVIAQDNDSLYVVSKDSKCYISYRVKLGETLFMLAKRFHCPPALIADANGFTYRNTIKDSTSILIPLGDYNYLKAKPENLRLSQIRRLFYKVKTDENNLSKLSYITGVSRENLQQWNRLYDNMIQVGDIFLVGWVVYDETQVPDYKEPPKQIIFEDKTKAKNTDIKKPVVAATPKQAPQEEKLKSKIVVVDEDRKNGNKNKTADKANVKELIIPILDTSKFKTSETEQLYMKQTHNETKITTEKGPAVFFDMAGGHGGNVFYGFHNSVPRGTIIKVYNPGTGKAIYVKILGPLPETKQYYNSIMGINSDAKEALGVKETRVWGELSFAAN